MASNNTQLQQVPGYLAAVHGATPPGVPFPNPTSQAQRNENARYVARQAGVEAAGVIDPKTGQTTDPNASHWYDPGTLGPLIVGASGLGVGLLGAPFAGAAAAGQGLGAATTAVPSMPWTLGAVGAANSTGAGLGVAGVDAALAGGPLASTAATPALAYAAGGATNAGALGSSVGGGGLWGGLQKIGGALLGNRGSGQSLWGPLAASSGLDLLGGYLSSRAANHAADQQLEYGNRALEFDKQRYADSQKNFAPFIANGQQANTTAAAQLMPTSGPAPTAANLAPQFMAPFQQNAQNNGSNMVLMRAPDGSTKQVPGNMVPHFTAKGATVIS